MSRTSNTPSRDDLSRQYAIDKNMRTKANALTFGARAIRARLRAVVGRRPSRHVTRRSRDHVTTALEIGIGSVENGQSVLAGLLSDRDGVRKKAGTCRASRIIRDPPQT